MSGSPTLVGILLCERVLQDILRRDAVSCINIHNGISAEAFPAIIPLVYIFAQVTGAEQEFEYQFKIYDQQGKAVAESPTAKVQPMPNKNMIQKIISAFTGLTFKKAGLYEVVLEIEGNTIGILPFQVVQLVPESIC